MQKNIIFGCKSNDEKRLVSQLYLIFRDLDRLARSVRIKRALQAKKVVESV